MERSAILALSERCSADLSSTRKSAQIDVISCAEQSAVGTVGLVGDDSKVRSGVGLARLDGLALEFSAQGRRQRGAGYEGLLQRGDVRACRVRFVEHDLEQVRRTAIDAGPNTEAQ